MSDSHIPVIVGIGEITKKLRDSAQALEPLLLMEQALRAAEVDAGVALLPRLDSLDVVAEYSWPYVDAPALLNARIGATPTRAVYGEVGGESPVRFIHEAALRIARGESTVCAVVGAEAAYSVAAAKKAGVTLDWQPPDPNAKLVRGKDLVNPIAYRHGVHQPVHVYPFYENAAQQAWGQTPRQALQESGELWSRFATVAANNPYAWLKKPLGADEITTPGEHNRLIAWPYTKSMVANPMVNQGAAVLLTSLAFARELGIAEERLVYVLGGAAANEPRDYLLRDQYQHSGAQDVVLQRAANIAGASFDAIELYSCFPCVPKMARRSLRLGDGVPLSVTGGLSFFGAPLNNYMTHAACALVRELRGRGNAKALLYGQGEYVTKHHALVLASTASGAQLNPDYGAQAEADTRRGPVPELVEDYDGSADIETFTVVYGREDKPEFGTVIARGDNGVRLMARVPVEDGAALSLLTSLESNPIGCRGRVTRGADGLLIWSRG